MVQPNADSEWFVARQSAAVFDLSTRPLIELAGPDAAAFLHNLCTNDVKNLPAGRGCEFMLTTNKARVVAHGIVHRLLPQDPPVLWLDLDPGSGPKTAAHLDHYIVSEQVTITDRSAEFCHLYLCGPRASAILTALFPALPPLENLQHVSLADVRIARNDWLGPPAYDFYCPAAQTADSMQRFVAAGALASSNQTWNTLRIEAGLPLDGIDMDADRFVVETGRLKQAISYAKGCYLGQEPIVMARDRGHANRMLMGLKIESTDPLAAGTRVMHGPEEIGQITSSIWSPLAQSVIGLAYLKRGHQEAGRTVEVGDSRAIVASLPFQSVS